MITMATLLATLLHRGNVRIELLLLVGSENRAERRDLTSALCIHLRAHLLHLRARRHGVTALTRIARFLHHRAKLLAALFHLGLLLFPQRLEPSLLGVGQCDALE